MSMRRNELKTLFEYLPAEIIFIIFDYLTNNDIIYTFFFLKQRFTNLILQNQRYLYYLELPSTNLNTWEKILSIIGSRIQSLNISTISLSFPLTHFSNLKSIIISSPHGYPDEELKQIAESIQFKHLHSFKIKENKFFPERSYDYHRIKPHYILEKVFTEQNSLKTLEYLFPILSMEHICETNFNLHSLTLTLVHFKDVFTLISYTPNLKYLNLRSLPPFNYENTEPTKKIDIKLERFYYRLTTEFDRPWLYDNRFNLNMLINFIKQFSLSLTCLSLNLVMLRIRTTEIFPFNSSYLQQFIESMVELKQFHLYTKVFDHTLDNESILSRFQDQFWFDHNISFGINRGYFYTLPFHFDYLYDFYGDFNDVKSSNPGILLTNPRIWYNVKSIDISLVWKYDLNFVKELKMKMSRLAFINFVPFYDYYMSQSSCIDEKKEEQITLDNVTTIVYANKFLEKAKKWVINALPNLTHLILYGPITFSVDSELAEILNKKIQRLDIAIYPKPEQFVEINYMYFSNVQYVNCNMDHGEQSNVKWYADNAMKILIECKNLKTLLIYIIEGYRSMESSEKTNLNRLIEHLDMKEIKKTYQVKSYCKYLLFSKREYSINRNQTSVLTSIWRRLSLCHRPKNMLE